MPVTLGPGEPFTTTSTVCFYAAILLCLPLLLYEAFASVTPALTPREKSVAVLLQQPRPQFPPGRCASSECKGPDDVRKLTFAPDGPGPGRPPDRDHPAEQARLGDRLSRRWCERLCKAVRELARGPCMQVALCRCYTGMSHRGLHGRKINAAGDQQ